MWCFTAWKLPTTLAELFSLADVVDGDIDHLLRQADQLVPPRRARRD
jgi:hypothetical protein